MKVLFSEYFKKQLKKLKKKYPHVVDDLLNVIDTFQPRVEISIGRSIYKIRIPSSDMQKGKSGGFRLYLYLHMRKNFLVPLCIYPKSTTESISQNELEYHLDQTIQEIVAQL